MLLRYCTVEGLYLAHKHTQMSLYANSPVIYGWSLDINEFKEFDMQMQMHLTYPVTNSHSCKLIYLLVTGRVAEVSYRETCGAYMMFCTFVCVFVWERDIIHTYKFHSWWLGKHVNRFIHLLFWFWLCRFHARISQSETIFETDFWIDGMVDG